MLIPIIAVLAVSWAYLIIKKLFMHKVVLLTNNIIDISTNTDTNPSIVMLLIINVGSLYGIYIYSHAIL